MFVHLFNAVGQQRKKLTHLQKVRKVFQKGENNMH